MRKQRREPKPAFPAPRPVHYAGYDFRSTLEARYAVFFDAAGVTWRYEPKWFNLPSGPYLSDFWLPRHQTWVEVKPRKTQQDAAKLSLLGTFGLLLTPDDLRIPDGQDDAPRHDLIDLYYNPEIVHGLCLVAPADLYDVVPYVVMEKHYFAECPKRCGGIGIAYRGRVHSCNRCSFDHVCSSRDCITLNACPVPEGFDTPLLRSAFQKAQRYRF